MSSKVSIEKVNGLFDLKKLYEWFKQAMDGIYLVEVKKVRKPIRTAGYGAVSILFYWMQ